MSGTDEIRRRVIARGRVQGVFFRASLERLAEERGVAGLARNRDDGAVEAVFEGPRRGGRGAGRLLLRGPATSGGERLEVIEEEPEGLSGFDVG